MHTAAAPCPAAPTGESHRWRLPSTGHALRGRCRWCGAEQTFQPDTHIDQAWTERVQRASQAGHAAQRQARVARKGAT